MTCVVVNDASCLIDLYKGRLLLATLELPYRFVLPLPIRHSELLDLTDRQWRRLDQAGLETFNLPPAQVLEAQQVRQALPRLSMNDCFCLVTVRHQDRGMLLTGDKRLRRTAEVEGLRVHGVLWVIDQLYAAGVCGASRLAAALKAWREDRTVFLPQLEIDQRLQCLAGGNEEFSG